MADYKNQINSMISHREKYFPVMTMLYNFYNDSKSGSGPVRVEDASSIAIILELIDIGYLDLEAFSIDRAFSEVKSLWYREGYPFTDKGSALFFQHLRDRDNGGFKYRYIIIALILTVLVSLLIFIL